jgi:hypothetical protein
VGGRSDTRRHDQPCAHQIKPTRRRSAGRLNGHRKARVLHGSIEDLLRFVIRDRIHLLVSSRPEGAVSPELLAVENVNVSEAQVLRSYTVVGEGLALVRCTGFLVIGDPHDQVQARFSLLAWFEYDAATTTPTSGELHSLDMLPT